MARFTLTVPGAISVGDGGAPPLYSTDPFVVGDPPQWDDSSDATYADLETFEHPDVSYADGSWGALETYALTYSPNVARTTVTAHIRFESLRAGMKEPRVFVRHSSMGQLLQNVASADSTAFTKTWTALDLTPAITNGLQHFLDTLNDGTLTLEVFGPFLRVQSFQVSRTRVYEAYLVVDTGTFVAPPLRQGVRSDGYGLMSTVRRVLPPPRSIQGGLRRHGPGTHL